MAAVEIAAQWLVDFGIYDVVLPFILVFTLIYGSLQKSKILGEDKNVDAAVATTIGFLVVASIQIVSSLQTIITITTVFFLIIILGFIIAGTLGVSPRKTDTKQMGFFAGLLLLGLLVFSVTNIQQYIDTELIQTILFSPTTITVLAFALVVWWITRGNISTSKSTSTKKPSSQSSSSTSPSQQKSPQEESSGEKPKRDVEFKERLFPKDITDER